MTPPGSTERTGAASSWACISFVPAPESIHVRDIFLAQMPQVQSPNAFSWLPAGRPDGARSYAQHFGPVYLVLGQHPRLLERRRLPFAPGRKRHHRRHIGARYGVNLDIVGVKA